MGKPPYPFRPKSNRWLEPGQFWAVPLSDGSYGCGRVMGLPNRVRDRRSLVAGLVNWIGDDPPRAEELAGRSVLGAGHAHIKTIAETGGEVLGHRALDADGLSPIKLETLHGSWGYEVIAVLAEHLRDHGSIPEKRITDPNEALRTLWG